MQKHSIYVYSILLVSGIFLSYLVQSALYLHSDIKYLMHIADAFLHGGTYGKDFLETNPPMILYLSMPPLFLSKITAISSETSYRIYFYSLTLISMLLCFPLLRKILPNQFTFYFFTLVILLVLLFLPAQELGQREHLFLILIFPYIFAAVFRLESFAIPAYFAILIGLLAGVGFCLKPYFLLPLICIEFYFVYHYKSILGWIRIETITIFSTLVIYLISTWWLAPLYFTIMLPMIYQFYFPSIQESWLHLLTVPIVTYCFSCLIIIYFFKKHLPTSHFITILALGTLGSTLAFLVTRTSWFYHTFPALAFACLLIALLMTEALRPTSIKQFALFIVIMLVFFEIPIANTMSFTLLHRDYKKHSDINLLAQYFAKQPGGHSVMCLYYSFGECYHLSTLVPAETAYRITHFWWLRTILLNAKNAGITPPGFHFFVGQIAEDMNHLQPRWIVTNTIDRKELLGEDYSYITHFSHNDDFRRAWKSYHYLGMIKGYEIFERNS